MPGPVSDSYDPEFGTGANAQDVADAIGDAIVPIDMAIGPKRKHIVQVAQGSPGRVIAIRLSEQQMRMLRFAAYRAIETL